jgi:PTS system mannose-specific IIC component
MGSYVPPFDSAVAILATAGSILAGRELGYVSKELVSLSILMFVPFGVLGQKMEICIRSSNNSLSDKVVRYAEEGDVRKISREHIYGLLKVFFGSVALVFVLLVPGLTILALVFPVLPDKFLEALRYTYYFIPILGVAVALNSVRLSRAVPVFSGLALVFALIAGMF